VAGSRHVIQTRGASEKLFYVDIGGENLPYMLQLLGFPYGWFGHPSPEGPLLGGYRYPR